MKINWRIVGRLGFLLVIMGFCMPIQCDQNGFQLANYAGGMFAFGMYVLFAAAVLGVIIGFVLLVRKVHVAFDWLLLIASVTAGLIIYFKNDAPELQYGAYVIISGWIVTFICLLVHAGTGGTGSLQKPSVGQSAEQKTGNDAVLSKAERQAEEKPMFKPNVWLVWMLGLFLGGAFIKAGAAAASAGEILVAGFLTAMTFPFAVVVVGSVVYLVLVGLKKIGNSPAVDRALLVFSSFSQGNED